jgi:hypothetical protein
MTFSSSIVNALTRVPTFSENALTTAALGYEGEGSFGRMAIQKKGCRVIAVTSWVFLQKKGCKMLPNAFALLKKSCKMLKRAAKCCRMVMHE